MGGVVRELDAMSGTGVKVYIHWIPAVAALQLRCCVTIVMRDSCPELMLATYPELLLDHHHTYNQY